MITDETIDCAKCNNYKILDGNHFLCVQHPNTVFYSSDRTEGTCWRFEQIYVPNNNDLKEEDNVEH